MSTSSRGMDLAGTAAHYRQHRTELWTCVSVETLRCPSWLLNHLMQYINNDSMNAEMAELASSFPAVLFAIILAALFAPPKSVRSESPSIVGAGLSGPFGRGGNRLRNREMSSPPDLAKSWSPYSPGKPSSSLQPSLSPTASIRARRRCWRKIALILTGLRLGRFRRGGNARVGL